MAEPGSAQAKLEVREFELRTLFTQVLEKVRRADWKYIRENHPDVYAHIKRQIRIVDKEFGHESKNG